MRTYVVLIWYGPKLKVTLMCMCRNHNAMYLYYIVGLIDSHEHVQSLALILNMKVESRVTASRPHRGD